MPRARHLLALLVALPAASLTAQFPPQSLKNIQEFPESIAVRALVDTMRSFTRALGVRCTYCHKGEEGQSLADYDFVSDDKVQKQKARAMLAMVRAINRDHLAALPGRVDPPLTVTCATCHRGVPIPRPIEDVVVATYQRAGLDSAVAQYRALRGQFYGRNAYDFGDGPLADAADRVAGMGKGADGLALHRLNVELLPTSGAALGRLGMAYATAGDTVQARAAIAKWLELEPGNRQAMQMQRRLGGN